MSPPSRPTPAGERVERVELGEPVLAGPDDPALHQIRAALDTRVRALLRHEPGTRLGADPEALHQMRVAVRRMRATLRATRRLLDKAWADELRAELGWLGRALGPVRDADVLADRLRGRLARLDEPYRSAGHRLLDALVADRERARGELLAVLDSDRYVALLRTLAAAVSAPLPPARRAATGGARRAGPQELVELVHVEFRALRKAVRNIGEHSADEALHRLRIKGKRLRYTAELAKQAGGEPIRELVTATKHLQDVLGEHQDAVVARCRVAELLAALGEAGAVDDAVRSAAAQLAEREESSRTEARAGWRSAWREARARAEALGWVP